MAIYNLRTISAKDLKKLVSEYITLSDISYLDECDNCGRLVLLHKEPSEECTRESDEGLEVIAKNWCELKRRLKPILKEIEEERAEEKKQNIYLEGIDRIVNTLKMNWNPSDDSKAKRTDSTGAGTVNNKPKLLTKLVKVPV